LRGRKFVDASGMDSAWLPVVRLWILRALVRCDGIVRFAGTHGFDNSALARFLGFTENDIHCYNRESVLHDVRECLARLERKPPRMPVGTAIARNVSRLAECLGLDRVEQDVLQLTALARTHSELSTALDFVGSLSAVSVCRLYGECLGHPAGAVQAALDDRGKLSRAALLSVDRARRYDFSTKIDVLDGLPEELMLEHEDLLDLFPSSVARSPAPRLALERYPHLAHDIAILRSYLEERCRQRALGVNVLIHGRPGTGKTEFVRALAHALGAKLHEVHTEEVSGKPRAGRARFDSYRFALSLLAGTSGNLLLFDEVEDVFCEARPAREREGNATGIKGWVNQLLERNPVPTFWVSNEIESIDPAYRRRFDYVLHLDIPPTSVRRELIDTLTCELPLTKRWRDQVADHRDMAPAIVERAVKVGGIVCQATTDLPAETVLTRVMNNTLDALGAKRLPAAGVETEMEWRLDLLNADCDLERLCEGLRRHGEGRICLYGPPGTGKTAFGRQVAKMLDRPLIVRRASDILSPYVGVAERNIARMFDEAQSEGAVLLLDEADSFLQDRRGAQRSWEVTLVNEMLTQMEGFRGVFVASTNLMDSLDEAAMRRFDAKVRLDYLSAQQAMTMFEVLRERLGVTANAGALSKLASMRQLTPGDFASVERLARLNSSTDARELLRLIEKGRSATPIGATRGIGFL